LYDSKLITKEKIRIFVKTNMLELVQDEINSLADDSSILSDPNLSKARLDTRTTEIFFKIDNEPQSVRGWRSFFDNLELVGELRSNGNLTVDYVAAHHGLTVAALDEYYHFSKFKYDCGMYSDAEDMIGKYLTVVHPQSQHVLGALWGRLACRVLQAKWAESLTDLWAVKEAIENRNLLPMDQLKQRAWLMHWALLVLLNQKDGAEALFDLYSERGCLQTMENLCPWLLRCVYVI
jgi:translation initiation factor 3 subunit E